MTVILAVLTIVVVLSVELILAVRRRRIRPALRILPRRWTRPSSDSGQPAPGDLHFHPGHSWVRLPDDGAPVVGTTKFAANFVGEIEKVETPPVGTMVRQGSPAWTLVSGTGRRLTQTMPLGGLVLQVNPEVVRDPGLTQRAPYEGGWILRIRPRRPEEDLPNLLPAASAEAWMDAIRSAVTARTTVPLGAVAADGGDWAPAFGVELENSDWETLRDELFPAVRDRPRTG